MPSRCRGGRGLSHCTWQFLGFLVREAHRCPFVRRRFQLHVVRANPSSASVGEKQVSPKLPCGAYFARRALLTLEAHLASQLLLDARRRSSLPRQPNSWLRCRRRPLTCLQRCSPIHSPRAFSAPEPSPQLAWPGKICLPDTERQLGRSIRVDHRGSHSGWAGMVWLHYLAGGGDHGE